MLVCLDLCIYIYLFPSPGVQLNELFMYCVFLSIHLSIHLCKYMHVYYIYICLHTPSIYIDRNN